MSGQSGIWMLICVAVAMLVTGLPAWLLLIGVSGAFAVLGIFTGALPAEFLSALPARLIGLLESDLLQALPLYVLMGVLLNRLPLAEALFACGSRLFKPLGASRSLAGLWLGVLMSPMNGSVGASVAMLTKTVLPKMEGSRSVPANNAAVVCVASTLGVVIPPSLVLILFADAMLRAHTEAINVTHVAVRIINTQDIFRGALIPAAIQVMLSLCVAWFLNRKHDEPENQPISMRQWVTAISVATLIVGLLSGVALGYLYAVEAAATGGMALLIYGVTSRKVTRPAIAEILRDTMAITGALFALLVAATTFTLMLRALGTDRWVGAWLGNMGDNTTFILAAVLIVLLLCSFVLDAFEMIFVVIPILIPPLLIRVPDPTWVAVIVLLILQLGFVLPPLGYAVMMISSQIKQKIGSKAMATALMPFVMAQLIVIAIVISRPQLLWRAEDTLSDGPNAVTQPLSEEEVSKLIQEQLQESQPTPTEAGSSDRKGQ